MMPTLYPLLLPPTHTNTHAHMRTDKRPTLLQLTLLKSPSGERVEIISTLAPDWKDFGIQLDFDDTGRTLDRIDREHPLRPIDCCTQMMREWLEGRSRQPATWATLIDLLKCVHLNVLAEQVERMLLELDTQPAAGNSCLYDCCPFVCWYGYTSLCVWYDNLVRRK